MIVCLEILGNTCLSHGMRQVGALEWTRLAPAALIGLAAHIFSNPWVILGVMVLVGYFLFYLTALSRLDLSYVLPVTASNYILTSILAWGLLRERISLTRWIGTGLICMGILLVRKSKRKKAAQPEEWETPVAEGVPS